MTLPAEATGPMTKAAMEQCLRCQRLVMLPLQHIQCIAKQSRACANCINAAISGVMVCWFSQCQQPLTGTAAEWAHSCTVDMYVQYSTKETVLACLQLYFCHMLTEQLHTLQAAAAGRKRADRSSAAVG